MAGTSSFRTRRRSANAFEPATARKADCKDAPFFCRSSAAPFFAREVQRAPESEEERAQAKSESAPAEQNKEDEKLQAEGEEQEKKKEKEKDAAEVAEPPAEEKKEEGA